VVPNREGFQGSRIANHESWIHCTALHWIITTNIHMHPQKVTKSGRIKIWGECSRWNARLIHDSREKVRDLVANSKLRTISAVVSLKTFSELRNWKIDWIQSLWNEFHDSDECLCFECADNMIEFNEYWMDPLLREDFVAIIEQPM
jgi:hypothetical protein